MTGISKPDKNKRAALECLLFMSSEPLSSKLIAEILGLKTSDVMALIQELKELNNREGRGLQVMEHNGKYLLCTKSEYSAYIEKLNKPRKETLSHAALETLGIIAYKQPISRAEIEFIRGVKIDSVLYTLVEKGLVKEVGRREGPGRPILYGTTLKFLMLFGLRSIEELPELEKIKNS